MAVEHATTAFMILNGCRPCPADGQYGVNSANFGIEAAMPGTCTGGTPAAPLTPASTITISGATQANPISITATAHGLSVGAVITITGVVGMTQLNSNTYMVGTVPDANHITLTDMHSNAINSSSYSSYTSGGTGTVQAVGGVIPTKTLGLDDSYAFDEWGRQITYVVDPRATLKTSCVPLQNYPSNNGVGGITIESSTGGTILTNAMAAYISHGQDGHGAFPEAGSSVANRINSGSTDTDELTNASVNSSFTASFSNIKVMKAKTSTFDDIVYYADYQKNLCCVGGATTCNIQGPGFRINGNSTNGHLGGEGSSRQHHGARGQHPGLGDRITRWSRRRGLCYHRPDRRQLCQPAVGVSIGRHHHLSLWLLCVRLGGHRLYSRLPSGTSTATAMTTSLCATEAPQFDVFYGHSGSFSSSYNMATPTTCQWTNFTDSGGGGARIQNAAIADVNNDGYKDLIVGDYAANSGKGEVFIIFGRANTRPGSEYIPAGTNMSNLTSATTPKGSIINGASSSYPLSSGWTNLTAGDVNGDGINDVIIGAWQYSSGGHSGRIYIVAGQATWPNSISVGSLTGIPNSSPACSSGSTTCGTVINGVTTEQRPARRRPEGRCRVWRQHQLDIVGKSE